MHQGYASVLIDIGETKRNVPYERDPPKRSILQRFAVHRGLATLRVTIARPSFIDTAHKLGT